MKKVMQKVLIFFMTTFFVATTVGIMSAAADEKTGLTRAEWIHTVISQFNMTVDDDNYPDNYFLDLDEESDYYRDFMIAVEFGMIDYEARAVYGLRPSTLVGNLIQ